MKSATARGPSWVRTRSPIRSCSIGCQPPGVATRVPSLKHFPPLLMVPADASAPRMKLTGPDAVPPPRKPSLEDRILERLTPAPDPPLKMIPSSEYHLRIESMESSTARIKQLCTRRLPLRYSPLSV